jgi:hypothetical protein
LADKWSRGDKLTLAGLVVGIVGSAAAVVVVPGIHDWVFGRPVDASPAPSPPTPPPPPAPKISFAEDRTLHERESAVLHGVIVTAGDFVVDVGITMRLSVSVDGREQYSGRSRAGNVIQLYRRDCDTLTVTIKNVNFNITNGMTLEQLEKLGMMAEAFVDRNAVVTLSGHCEY